MWNSEQSDAVTVKGFWWPRLPGFRSTTQLHLSDLLRNMRILIEPGSAHGRNIGDIMLQVAYRRFRGFWQDATLHIVTGEPEQLVGIDQGVKGALILQTFFSFAN